MRQRFVESTFVTKENVIPVESAGVPADSSLTEGQSGKKYKYIAAYRMPVSKYNYRNANGRMYPKALWENVIKNQNHIWEGSVGLADHPGDEDDGSVRNIYGVWKNLGLKEQENGEGLVEADLYLVGPYGRLAQEVIEAGGKLGFSSSGLGELKEDQETVNPESFLIERISDWVLSPSQGVFGTLDMQIQEKIKEADEKMKSDGEDSFTVELNLPDPPKQDDFLQQDQLVSEKEKKTTMSQNVKFSKLEDRKFRKDVEEFLTEAENLRDPLAKKRELLEIRSYFAEGQAPDLKAEIEKKIEEVESELRGILDEHEKLEDTFGVDKVEKLKQGVQKVALDKELYERQTKDYKKIVEGLQRTIKKYQSEIEARPTVEAYENVLKNNRSLREHAKKREGELTKKVKSAIKKYKEELAIEKALTDEIHSLSSNLKEMKNKVRSLQEQVKGYKSTIKDYEAMAEEALKNEKEIKEKAKKLDYKPKSSLKESMFKEFSENDKVGEYYEDLLKRHGGSIKPYKEKILACKTLFEATRLYTNLLPDMGKMSILETNDPNLRAQFVESETGYKIRKSSDLNLPEGWE